MKIIEIKSLVKSYHKKEIITIPHLTVESGKIYLIVGENGSGKSTLIKMLLRIYFPTNGIIHFYKNETIGYAPEKLLLPNHLKVFEILYDLAIFRKMEEEEAKKRIFSLLKEWNLDPQKKLHTLSKGMLQKLIIIQAIMHYPKWYFFDEPLNGFDKESQKKFIQLIKQLKLHKKTILITSHYPQMVEKYADYIWHINNGIINERIN